LPPGDIKGFKLDRRLTNTKGKRFTVIASGYAGIDRMEKVIKVITLKRIGQVE